MVRLPYRVTLHNTSEQLPRVTTRPKVKFAVSFWRGFLIDLESIVEYSKLFGK